MLSVSIGGSSWRVCHSERVENVLAEGDHDHQGEDEPSAIGDDPKEEEGPRIIVSHSAIVAKVLLGPVEDGL